MYFGFLDVVYVEVEWTTGVFVKKAEVVCALLGVEIAEFEAISANCKDKGGEAHKGSC